MSWASAVLAGEGQESGFIMSSVAVGPEGRGVDVGAGTGDDWTPTPCWAPLEAPHPLHSRSRPRHPTSRRPVVDFGSFDASSVAVVGRVGGVAGAGFRAMATCS